MRFSTLTLSPAEFALAMPTLMDIHLDAMGYSDQLREPRLRSWREHVRRPGFRCVVAHDEDHVIGFAFGFLGTPETWWHRQVARAIQIHGGDTSVLTNYFEVAEVHVSPTYQGFGVGTQILTEVLQEAPGTLALLSTPEVAGESNGAFHLYRRFGFYDVVRNMIFPGDSRPFAVLGRRLA
ncbi:putative GCN5-related N-acetyltransferase [Corynebacterium renale]|uniref:Ribosomal protein S18 acetylase RimI-like enzyme n=1 Tax=Corynebacterium renale TaxID=1724 RepID=A0A2A9DR65_9CORY|nr:GNAT family N-acetyltransferase [Corynebacterium renale]PFG28390.1 ribosomal protein S18 acetylase RimI-like enzyme [Corynebacterium renale]SQG65018.1 putative GCN5-related N-acetyltransferase [Corynebacterium renale]SQI18790.1 putative GCN5-related N-acetyltransferase [Corynebacterium renale]STC97144.1 putative GCN5-related N-acetyltransferase [Corynebacterium renale]